LKSFEDSKAMGGYMLPIFLTFGNLISGFISLVSNSLILTSYQQQQQVSIFLKGIGQATAAVATATAAATTATTAAVVAAVTMVATIMAAVAMTAMTMTTTMTTAAVATKMVATVAAQR
jgi:hypothetical protein